MNRIGLGNVHEPFNNVAGVRSIRASERTTAVTNPQPLVSEWIAPQRDPPASQLSCSIGSALREAAARWPERDAVIYRHQPAVMDTVWSYSEINQITESLAAALLHRGYQPGDRIGVWAPNCPEWILLEYAIAKAGLVLVALNPLYKRAELEFVLRDSRIAGLFHADEIGGSSPAPIIEAAAANAPDLREYLPFSGIHALVRKAGRQPAVGVEVDPAGTFMIQYTSGTTGTPKAVRLSHGAITTTAMNSYRLWGLTEGSRVCHGFPLFHVGGSGNSVPGAALNGASTLPLYIFKAGITLDILEREECTAFIGVPTMLLAMLEDPTIGSRSFERLQKIIVGGAPVTEELLQRCRIAFGAEVTNCYGQTETCGVTTTTLAADTDRKKTCTSGRPLAGVSVAIRNDAGLAVPRGQVGELYYRGPGAMCGYGAFPSITEPALEWIASGDLARMDEDGYVTIVGRKKEMIIRGGENLSPVEIETLMRGHPEILDVAVIGVPDQKYGEELCAVVRRAQNATATGEDIRSWCAERISRWKVPRYVEFIDEFPLTPSGKIRKFVLQDQMTDRLGLPHSPKHPTSEGK